jgi:O-antigen ligase
MIFLMPLIAFLMIFWLINSPFADVVKELLLGYSSEGEGLNALFSGRFSLFGDAIKHIKQHPIFGNGVSYEKLGFTRTHNVFLQMTYENGIVGLLCFVAFLTVCLKRIYKCRNNNNYCYAFYIATPFILMNAMVEESLLTNFMDMLTLLFLGTMNEKTKETRDNV